MRKPESRTDIECGARHRTARKYRPSMSSHQFTWGNRPPMTRALRSSSNPSSRKQSGRNMGDCLSLDERNFVEAAFRCILSDDEYVPASGRMLYAQYVARKLAQSVRGSGCLSAHADGMRDDSMIHLYKAGIFAVQAHCLRMHGHPFQDLAVWRQSCVLAVMEDGGSADDIGTFHDLFQVMVNDAAEAYFDANKAFFRTGG